jgi:phenylacetate-CoA ligase
LVDYYGQAERVAFAYSNRSHEYYFLPGYAQIELLYVDSERGRDLYEIIGTPLWNLAMPLIRYRTGDLIQVKAGTSANELEDICYGTRSFLGIVGRSDDYLISPEGVKLVGIDHIPRDVNHVAQMQVIQESENLIRLLVVPYSKLRLKDQERILRNAREKLPASMQIKLEVVEKLEKTSTGKTPYVIRRKEVDRRWHSR